MEPDKRILKELVRRIVEAVHPERIILFGSAARGNMGPNSDLDVLVVMPDGTPRRKTAQRIYRALLGLGFATDILVATQSLLREHGDNPFMVYHEALSHGKEVYRAA